MLNVRCSSRFTFAEHSPPRLPYLFRRRATEGHAPPTSPGSAAMSNIQPQTRRQFLSDVGKGMLIATIGPALAADLALAKPDDNQTNRLTFGPLEPLVNL